MIKTRLVRLLSHAKKYIVYNVMWQWMALIAQVVSVFTIAGLFGKLYAKKAASGDIVKCACVFAAVLVVRFLCDKMAVGASYKASVDVKCILRDKIYEKLLKLGVSYNEKIATSEVVQLSTEGVEQLEIYFGKYLPQLFYSILAPVTLFIVLAAKASIKAGVVLLLCVPLIPASIVAVQKIAKKLLNNYWGIYTELGDSFLENLQGLTTLKIYQADGMKAEQMDEEAAEFRKITMKVLTMQLNSTSVMDIVAYGGAVVGMIVALSEFLKGNITLEQTLCIVLLASEFFIPLRLLGSFFHIAMNGMAASDKIFGLLDLEEDKTGKVIFTKEQLKNLSVRFEDVNFSYNSDRKILNDVSLDISPGSFVSLVGESGCGKSTIAGLISGKNKKFNGRLTLSGVPIGDIAESELMRHVTVVRHNSYLFKGTVRENLIMADLGADDEKLKAVLIKVNLWDFVSENGGLDMEIAEKGDNLSGGQCQRLCIARAILHDSEMYIFDEAASNIDAESEGMIMDAIHELAKTKTVLLISHRLFNVISSDNIYMLKDGEIAESGTHEQLMKKSGEYFRLFESQRRMEEFGKEDDDVCELMRHVTVVRHNSYLFKGTVRENLIMADLGADDEKLKAVLIKVNLWDFVSENGGLDMEIAEKGDNLSGGQCQRLCIARAILHDSEMYIFDEAASNIDAESEGMIMDAIHELAKTKTVLLISHRLFNVISSDNIYMLKDGEIAESGTHEQLMKKSGEYFRLFESQRRMEEFGKEDDDVCREIS